MAVLNAKRNHLIKRAWRVPAAVLILLSIGVIGQVPSSAATVATRNASAKLLLHDARRFCLRLVGRHQRICP